MGKKKLKVEIAGGTGEDVIEELIRHYGKKARDAFYDQDGKFDLMIQIALNGKPFIHPDRRDTPLNEGDQLIFMVLLAGG